MPKLIWLDRMVLVPREIAMGTFYQAPCKMEEGHIYLHQIGVGTKALKSRNALKVWHPVTP
jgi:hypothetical protein